MKSNLVYHTTLNRQKRNKNVQSQVPKLDVSVKKERSVLLDFITIIYYMASIGSRLDRLFLKNQIFYIILCNFYSNLETVSFLFRFILF